MRFERYLSAFVSDGYKTKIGFENLKGYYYCISITGAILSVHIDNKSYYHRRAHGKIKGWIKID